MVGRLFIKHPTGWRSESVKTFVAADAKYAGLRVRLKDSTRPVDKAILAYLDGEPVTGVPPALKTQLDAMIFLHKQNNELRKMSREIKEAGNDLDKARFIKEQMVLRAQAALAGNEEFVQKMDFRLKDYR